MVGLSFGRCELLENSETFYSQLSLTKLQVSCLTEDEWPAWPTKLITYSWHSLKSLALGFKIEVAFKYYHSDPDWSDLDYHRFTEHFGSLTTGSGHLRDRGNYPHVEELELTGFDLKAVVDDALCLGVDFDNLKRLHLYSCGNLIEAFRLLQTEHSTEREKPGVNRTLKNLANLKIRYERADSGFQSYLQELLVSLPSLTPLQVLLEGASQCQNIEPILKNPWTELADACLGRKTSIQI